MKGIERVTEKIIRERVLINEIQYGFMSGRNTTQLTKYSSSDSCTENIWLRTGNCNLLLLTLKRRSIDYQVIWWATKNIGVEDWIVKFVQAMYNNTRCKVTSQKHL